ncbi:hypothetical protein KIPB_014506 [Kipferlia bialata]|uniref:Uncharacterized protein n=1 Tax=Kipferlia bialata TaxID=797122 RepID=A0A9K3DBQ1_9EUKA|nr:hypothetical protein KIPB_014506 [Kipferlia bialata]|eukprot:g14506.t1
MSDIVVLPRKVYKTLVKLAPVAEQDYKRFLEEHPDGDVVLSDELIEEREYLEYRAMGPNFLGENCFKNWLAPSGILLQEI